ncbi:hypothetical protein J6590_023256 [Homalodisca vitripennis]|nr:hypothetical protein J6590_023256 [Homalodisca vitripennis]
MSVLDHSPGLQRGRVDEKKERVDKKFAEPEKTDAGSSAPCQKGVNRDSMAPERTCRQKFAEPEKTDAGSSAPCQKGVNRDSMAPERTCRQKFAEPEMTDGGSSVPCQKVVVGVWFGGWLVGVWLGVWFGGWVGGVNRDSMAPERTCRQKVCRARKDRCRLISTVPTRCPS